MKTATVRQLRHDFGSVLAWVEDGERVEISKRGKVVALVFPPSPVKRSRAGKRPDFVARMKRIYGSKLLRGNIVVEERETRSY